MSENEHTYSKIAQLLLENDYFPVPIKPGTKAPRGLSNWPNATADDVANWTLDHHAGWGVGLRSGDGLLVLDFDVWDADLTTELLSKADEQLGKTPTRFGKKGGAKLYRCDGFGPSEIWNFPDFDEKKQQVEVRGDKQQLVAFSVHPDTNQPYRWGGCSPLDLKFSDLPVVKLEEVRDFLRSMGGTCSKVAKVEEAAPKIEVSLGSDYEYIDNESYVKALPPQLRRKITSKPRANTDKSADLYYVIKELHKRELSVDNIEYLITDFPDGIGAKYLNRSDLRKEIDRVIAKPSTGLIEGAGGKPVACLANVRTLLNSKDWVGAILFNEFANRIEISKQAPINTSVADLVDGVFVWNDTCDTLTAEWMSKQGVNVNSSLVAESVEATAREHSFHPVRNYLESLNWDGKPRLATWLEKYLGVTSTYYSKAVGKAWMIGAVARIQDPGCKMDYALILEGPQGLGKSSALRALGGDWFNDELGDPTNKDTKIVLHSGIWILEIGELDAMSRSEVNNFKQFMSAQSDLFRPAYPCSRRRSRSRGHLYPNQSRLSRSQSPRRSAGHCGEPAPWSICGAWGRFDEG